VKNRTYKNRNRAIKQLGPDHWECRLIPGKGETQIAPFATPTKDGAFNWLRGGATENITPGYLNSRARRTLRRAGKMKGGKR
jgi:hypothetical protein